MEFTTLLGAPPQRVDSAMREGVVVELLSGLLQDVTKLTVASNRLTSGATQASDPTSAGILARTIQAQGIHFQLLAIAEQNAAMYRRRQIEVQGGYDNLRGTFAYVIAEAAAKGTSAEEMRQVIRKLRIR